MVTNVYVSTVYREKGQLLNFRRRLPVQS